MIQVTSIILLLVTLLIFQKENASSFSPAPYTNKQIPMVWIDGRYRYGTLEVDTFFDRVVIIYIFDKVVKGGKLIGEPLIHKVTGVFIRTDLVLTSFNAFRNLSSTAETLHKMRISYMRGRGLTNESRTSTYIYDQYQLSSGDVGNEIVCGRQVIPSDPSKWPTHMRHGPNTPAHDLMVLRLKTPIAFINPIPPPREDFLEFTTAGTFRPNNFSPIRTILARPGDKMYTAEMRFVSVGHLSDEHIELQSYLEKGEFGKIEDCEEWLPREWGHFICLGNSKNYPGLAAGAMLYSGEQLFGVGAFMLKKGKESILVFTDVRPYWHLLYRTCSIDDQNRVKKNK